MWPDTASVRDFMATIWAVTSCVWAAVTSNPNYNRRRRIIKTKNQDDQIRRRNRKKEEKKQKCIIKSFTGINHYGNKIRMLDKSNATTVCPVCNANEE